MDEPVSVRIVDIQGIYRRGERGKVLRWADSLVLVEFPDGDRRTYARSLVEEK